MRQQFEQKSPGVCIEAYSIYHHTSTKNRDDDTDRRECLQHRHNTTAPATLLNMTASKDRQTRALQHTTIESIFDRACCSPEVREATEIPVTGAVQLGRTRESLAKAWNVLNKWALEKLSARGAIEIPNFARVGWQRFRRRDGEVIPRMISTLDNEDVQTRSIVSSDWWLNVEGRGLRRRMYGVL